MAPRLVDIAYTNIQSAYLPVNPGILSLLKHVNSTHEGAWNNASMETISGTNGRDVIYGNGGSDYIYTGNGDDKLVAGSNNSLWHGQGNEFTAGATTLDGGADNDDFILNGSQGAFQVITGEGQDDVSVTGLTHVNDYVRINAYDNDGARDTFTFGSAFNGHADIWGADAQDAVTLKGGDWHYDSHSDAYYNSTGGSVTLSGVTHGYNDPDVFFV